MIKLHSAKKNCSTNNQKNIYHIIYITKKRRTLITICKIHIHKCVLYCIAY